MKAKFLIFIILGFLFIFFGRAENVNQENEEKVFVVEIQGEIKAGTYQYLKRAIKEAESQKADYLIIKIDTPGGLLKATKDIVDLILNTPVKTIVFVYKEGGWAYSAGTFILLAADFAVSHPLASIGAAQPYEFLTNDELKKGDSKIIEATVSWIKTLAEANKRNSEIVEKFIRENLTLTGEKAKELGIINETARDLDELFSKLNISNPKITKISLNIAEKIFDFLSHPYIVSLLLTLGFLLLIMAIKAGEFEFSGAVGIISLLIGLWGLGVVSFSFIGIAFLSIGVFLLILEFFEAGFGLFGIAGTIFILLGIFTFEKEPFLNPKLFELLTMIVISTIIVFNIAFFLIGRAVMKAYKTKPFTGPESLIGLKAEVVEDLKPRGRVKIKEEIWSAESFNGEIISKKSKVEIIKIEGNTLIVKPC
jgi:membrane-bound serine protease (ClpP class)